MRELTGLLTQYWTGEDMVAAVTDIRCERGEFWFVTELVGGEVPSLWGRMAHRVWHWID